MKCVVTPARRRIALGHALLEAPYVWPARQEGTEHSPIALDRGILVAEILCGLMINGPYRHFLIPATANTHRNPLRGSAENARAVSFVSAQEVSCTA